jgi:hypothetical protein
LGWINPSPCWPRSRGYIHDAHFLELMPGIDRQSGFAGIGNPLNLQRAGND